MAFKSILLVLPILALASIHVEISIRDANDLKVDYKGFDLGIISETEETTFNVNTPKIFECTKLPSNTRFVPGKNGDKWGGVARVLKPTLGKIFWESGRPTIVASQNFVNNSTIPVTFNVGISQSVLNTASTSWSTSGELCGIKINYVIKNKVANVDGKPFSYTSSWGQHTLQLQTVKVGASSNMDMTIQPGQAIVAQLEAVKQLVKVEIKYDARLAGYIMTYNKVKPGSHASQNYMNINTCMQNLGNTNQRTSREFIDIEFFSYSKVVVSDLRQGGILMELR